MDDETTLSNTEWMLWSTLKSATCPLSSDELRRIVWRGQPPASSSALSVLVHQVRAKMPRCRIEHVRGVGWTMAHLRGPRGVRRVTRSWAGRELRLIRRDAAVFDMLKDGGFKTRHELVEGAKRLGVALLPDQVDTSVSSLRAQLPGMVETSPRFGEGWRLAPEVGIGPEDGTHWWDGQSFTPRPKEARLFERLSAEPGARVGRKELNRAVFGDRGGDLERCVHRLRKLLPGRVQQVGGRWDPGMGWRLLGKGR